MYGDILVSTAWGIELLPACSVLRPGVLLNILQHTSQPAIAQTYLTPNINSVMAENPGSDSYFNFSEAISPSPYMRIISYRVNVKKLMRWHIYKWLNMVDVY